MFFFLKFLKSFSKLHLKLVLSFSEIFSKGSFSQFSETDYFFFSTFFKRRMEEELKIEEMKLEMKKKNEDKIKFPKLVVTKYEGTHLDWC